MQAARKKEAKMIERKKAMKKRAKKLKTRMVGRCAYRHHTYSQLLHIRNTFHDEEDSAFPACTISNVLEVFILP